MTRPLRIDLTGGLYHVTSRGDHRADVYLDDTDRANLLDLFGDVSEHVNRWCHVYRVKGVRSLPRQYAPGRSLCW
jgi:hypothetical protein